MATPPVGTAWDQRSVGAQVEEEERLEAAEGEPPHAPAKPPRGRLGAALKDASIAALIALLLFGPMIGLKTVTTTGGLFLRSRGTEVLIAVAVVFIGRLLLSLFVWRPHRPVRIPFKTVLPGADALTKFSRAFGPLLLAIAILLPFITATLFPGRDRYIMDLAILVLTYVMLGWGLNIVVGLAGLLDLGYVAFYAVGAYSYALLATQVFPPDFAWAFWLSLPLAGLLAALWGMILGFPVLRLRGDYLAIVTLAFGEIIRIVLLNWYEFTGGPNGISQIPRPSFFGLEFSRGEGGFADFFGLDYSSMHRILFLYYLILTLALITNLVTLRLRRLPIGRAWEALREDEIACRSLGINTTTTKLTAFAIGAMFGGFAGSFFATRQGFISPESFTFLESAVILAIVVLGGLGSQIGIVVAAIVMIGGIELLRNLGFLSEIFGPGFDPTEYRMLLFGLAMVLIMVWRPRGLVSTRTPTVALFRRKAIGAEHIAQGEGH
jgi:branched-chain amino acid transport system permease protein